MKLLCLYLMCEIVIIFLSINVNQGSHRLEKYLNIQDCLEKSLKIKFTFKVLENDSKALE